MSAQQATAAEEAAYKKAVEHVKTTGNASISQLQAALKISYNGAALLLDRMERDGIVSAEDPGDRTRQVMP